MEVGSFDGGIYHEHNSIIFVEMSKTFAMQNEFFFEVKPFDGVYSIISIYRLAFTAGQACQLMNT